MAEMKRADGMLRDTFKRGGADQQYRCNFYPGGHKFDREMQADAFAWFDAHLGKRKPIIGAFVANGFIGERALKRTDWSLVGRHFQSMTNHR
jgi:hypothetical protein